MLELRAGDVFANRFDIVGLAGAGGMGTVYRATDRFTGDTVALKLLRALRSSAREGERFAREAHLLADLRHPGIVSYVAHGEIPDGQRFLAMEWLEGEDLATRLERGPLALRDALNLARSVAEALAIVHERGVIHRDVKPTNLFLPAGDLGRVKLLDLGIARRLTTSNPLTRTGGVIGTPDYMAPEQARGSREVTTAADVFSLGCVLHECLTGEPPFAADTVAAVLARILFEEPRKVTDALPGIPPRVVDLLGRMLAKLPERRISSGATLARELTQLGEVPDVARMATLVATPSDTPPPGEHAAFAETEQGLFSAILMIPPAAPTDRDAFTSEQVTAVQRELQALGARSEYLISGAMLATVVQPGSATDQAAVAARAGLMMKARWPAAEVSLATGRGRRNGAVAVGEVVDRAARFPRRTASPAGVWIDELTRKLLDARFVVGVEPDGALLTAEDQASDLSRPLLGKPTPCVGREAELGTLESQLRACIEESEARAVVITAQPGVGKSRLRHELMRRLAARSEPVTVLYGAGDLMSAGAPYGIVGAAIRGVEPARLVEHVADADRDRVAVFLGELASRPVAANDAMLVAARADARILRDRIRRAFLDWLAAECAQAPVVIVLDDLQWGDALSVGLIDDALRELAGAPLYAVALARPELAEAFPRLWQGAKLQQLRLEGLSRRACERLVEHVLGKKLAPQVIARLVDHAAGNALFLEELIRAAAEGKTDHQPETVLAMLQARIGRFESGPRRAVLAASVYGQTLWRGGVAAVLGVPRTAPELDKWLGALRDAEVIQPSATSRLAGETEYQFRHALVREAAYGLLSPGDLVTGHRLAGVFLDAAGEPDAAVVADHHERGGDRSRAASAYGRAAEHALERNANETTLRHVERAVACGADGELLGTVRAHEALAQFLLGKPQLSFPPATEALRTLRPGSLAWTRAMFGGCLSAGFGPPEWQAQFPAMAAQLFAVDPEPDAVAVYVEAVSHTISTVAAVIPAPFAPVIERIAALCDRAAARDPAVRRHLLTARSRCLRYCTPDVWQIVSERDEMVALAKAAGDVRNLYLAAISDMGWVELGAPERALANMREYDDHDRYHEEVAARTIRDGLISSVLAQTDDDAAHTRALALAAQVIERLGPFPLTTLLSHNAIARVRLHRGELDAAEDASRVACAIVDQIPSIEPNALAVRVQILLAAGKVEEARAEATRIRALLAQWGCLGHAEVELRLALVDTAEGDARAGEIAAVVRQVWRRADAITDPDWRRSYLERNPHCARALSLVT